MPTVTAFNDDDGSCPPLLAQALASRVPLAIGAAVRHSRLLIPVVPAPEGSLELDEHDACGVGDGMASVTFIAGDGRRALLGFSSVAALQAWDPHARPMPQVGEQIARTVIEAELDALIVDIGSEHRTALQGTELRIAAGLS